jgi:hypothetical protein
MLVSNLLKSALKSLVVIVVVVCAMFLVSGYGTV